MRGFHSWGGASLYPRLPDPAPLGLFRQALKRSNDSIFFAHRVITPCPHNLIRNKPKIEAGGRAGAIHCAIISTAGDSTDGADRYITALAADVQMCR